MNIRYDKEVSIPLLDARLKGELIIPEDALGVIVFSHGSGSSRFSMRNRFVAAKLHEHGLGTLLLDLLTPEEDLHYSNRFDIRLLTKRLVGALLWLEKQPEAADCRIGLFGASTGAASAMRAAVLLPQIAAVVSRGGRPDMAFSDLSLLSAPTLLIVGGLDTEVLQYNRRAYDELGGTKRFEVVEGASHLFEEPGAMNKVADLAAQWFEQHLLHTLVM